MAFVAPLTAFLGSGTVGAALAGAGLRLLAGVALSALGRALQGKPKGAEDKGIATEFTGEGDVTPQSFILGHYATAGHLMCPDYAHDPSGRSGHFVCPDGAYGRGGNGGRLTRVISLTDAPVGGLSGLYVDGHWYGWGEHFQPDANYGRRCVAGPHSGKLWLEFHDGTQTAPSPYLRGAYGNHPARPWGPEAVHRGGAYAVLTFEIDPDVYKGGVPQVKFVIDGLPLLDPRTGAVAPTNNPALQIWHLFQTIEVGPYRYGVGLPREALPDAIWLAAMNKCDIGVADGAGGSEPQYRAGLEVRMAQPDGGGMEPLDAIDTILRACSGGVAEVAGDIHIRVGAPSLPVAMLTDDDILITEDETHSPIIPLADIYNSVAATFPDPANKWAATDADPVTDAAGVGLLGEVRQGSADLKAAPYANQVRRLMAAWLADAGRGRAHSFALPGAWAARMVPLATIGWTSALHGYDAKLFEVQQGAVDPLSGQVSVTIREVDPADYDTSQVPVQPPALASQPLTVIPFALGDLALYPAVATDANGVPRRAGIEAIWTAEDRNLGAVRLEFRLAGATEIVLETGTVDGSTGRALIFEGVLPATTYEGRGTAVVQGASIPTDWIEVTTAAVGLTSDDFAADLRDAIDRATTLADEESVLALVAFGDAQDAQDKAETIIGDLEITAQTVATLTQTVGDATGAIENLQQLSVTEQAAFADYQQTVSANFGDIDARVTQNNLALVDVEGFAYASAGISAEVSGGRIVGLKLTSYSNPDGSGGGLIEADGVILREGTVTLDRLVVGQGRNLLQDSDLASGTRYWTLDRTGAVGSGAVFAAVAPGQPYGATADNVLSLKQAASATTGRAAAKSMGRQVGTQALTRRYLAVVPGLRYFASARVLAVGCTATVGIVWLDAGGTEISETTSATIAAATSPDPAQSPRAWSRHGISGQAPATAAFAQIAVAQGGPATAGAGVYWWQPQLEETHAAATEPSPYGRSGTTLIDGDRIITDTLIVRTAMIEDGAIVAAKIANAAITNAKISDLAVTRIKIPVGELSAVYSTSQPYGGDYYYPTVAAGLPSSIAIDSGAYRPGAQKGSGSGHNNDFVIFQMRFYINGADVGVTRVIGEYTNYFLNPDNGPGEQNPRHNWAIKYENLKQTFIRSTPAGQGAIQTRIEIDDGSVGANRHADFFVSMAFR